MLEKKKDYEQPEMKVVVLDGTEILCTSNEPSPQNEEYEEVDEAVTRNWFI